MPRSEFRDLPINEYMMKLRLLMRIIENNLGEPHNPDDMLALGQALLVEIEDSQRQAISYDLLDAGRLDHIEDRAFEAVTAELAKAKKFVDYFAGREFWATLDFPVKMPRSREKVREAARAVLAAWDEHSADPELVRVIPAMTDLRAAFDAFVLAWDAQQNAKRIKKEKYRAAKEARAKCEKFVSRVKKYLSLYLEPDSSKWGLYGFERREKE